MITPSTVFMYGCRFTFTPAVYSVNLNVSEGPTVDVAGRICPPTPVGQSHLTVQLDQRARFFFLGIFFDEIEYSSTGERLGAGLSSEIR